MTAPDPEGALAAARAAVERVAAARMLLVALDFDGTLSPLVDDPRTAAALPEARAAIEALIELPGTRVAVVSGRHLGGLAQVARMPADVVLVGSHGAESLVDGEEEGPTLTPGEAELFARLCAIVEDVASRFPGALFDLKPSGCGLHTRLCTEEDARAAREAVLSEVAALEASAAGGAGAIGERFGKDIVEFAVRPADKGSALERLRERFAASAVLFIGDDVTDEDGFRVLGPRDAGVLVGPPESAAGSAAEFRVASPAEVAALLRELADSRERVAGAPR
jgi:trehalose 6-phosphate phosphatase